MFIKRLLAKIAEKLTGKKCSRCAHNCAGRCAHPSDGMFMKCWHGITRPGFEYSESVAFAQVGAAAAEGLQAGLDAPLTAEEQHQLEKIKAVLQEAEDTARDGGLVED